MVPYVVRAGDHLARIAQRYGFAASDAWNHPQNAELKELRGGAGNVLASGDILYIPKPEKKWRPVAVGQQNVFVANIPTTLVNLRIAFDGQACKNAEYRVQCQGTEQTGTTDGNGKLSFNAPVTAWCAVVLIQGKPRIPVRIGHLDPVETRSGVIQRLRHLKYLPHAGVHGDDDTPPDWLSSVLPAAISDFQRASHIEATGTMDDSTRKSLVAAHGC